MSDDASDDEVWERLIEEVTKMVHNKHVDPVEPYIPTDSGEVFFTLCDDMDNKAPFHSVIKPSSGHSSFMRLTSKQKRQLKKGNMAIDSVIDLHGYHLDQAYRYLHTEIQRAYMQQKRVLLVITGKGSRSANAEQTLRRLVPQWLEEATLSPVISAVGGANPNHGGEGALYVVLKRIVQ